MNTDNITMSYEESIQSSIYGITIKVENLTVCRTFYRDILRLGAPIMDSNFWVEFKLKNNVSLLLDEAGQGEKLPSGRGRISWMCEIKDFDDTVSLLKEKGHEPISEEEEQDNKRMIQFCDPEGNPFYLVADK
jgi:catechol 2,3-dioxygenase-like lactoylglutathione lyase family enzyme